MSLRGSILVVEDDAVLNRLLLQELQRMGHRASGVRRWSEAQLFLAENEPDLIIMDGRLPDADGIDLLPSLSQVAPVVILTAYGTVQNAVRAMKGGAAEYLVKPINLDELEVVVERVLENAALRREHQFFKTHLEAQMNRSAMVGNSPAIARLSSLIDAVAGSDMTVLIQGESGVGKELVANAIHQRSHRANHNYVAVDCCTLQKNLFESELFGHERGAFTGADRRKEGLIEGAVDGTLFLDEIGEIEPPIQAKLLRVLETGKFRRLGGTKDLRANVRIVAATNRDLEKLSRLGEFRADLYYRLNAFTITVPPLRERREDIPALVDYFIRNHDFSKRISKTVTPEAFAQLLGYDWPGNVRELKNVVERAIILSGDSNRIGSEHLAIGSAAPTARLAAPVDFDGEPTLDEIKRNYLRHLLGKYGGHRSKVAKALGISERNTYRLIGKYELDQG